MVRIFEAGWVWIRLYTAGIAACAMLIGVSPLHASDISEPLPLKASDFLSFDVKRAELGQLLFYDPILSGNRNISCGTCHHHTLASGDGLALGVGEGGEGLGARRTAGQGASLIERRVPRNAPALFNLGARDIRVLFHDGRLSVSNLFDNRFKSPAEEYLPGDLEHIVAAQALFPIVSHTEMAGDPEENEIAGRVNDRIDYAWAAIVERVRAVPGYLVLFQSAFSDVETLSDISISHVGNAIGDFVIGEWQSFDTPYDAYLNGDTSALTSQMKVGMDLFFGSARCATCHSGPLLSDQKFHALALPHFGPGRTRRFDPYVRDVGHMAVTDRLEDAYRFRTPMLRNVALTGPYGHNGAYANLEGIIRHHLDPLKGFDSWTRELVDLPSHPTLENVDFVSFQDKRERMRQRSRVDITPMKLGDDEVAALVSFLHSLTGKKSVEGRLGRPESVPSGLPVD